MKTTQNHIIFCSGGKSSFAVADYVKSNYPEDNIVLYFTDVMWENFDLYRFIDEASDKLQLPMLTHSRGINPIQLMFEQKVIFNSLIGACSRILKMEVASNYLKKNITPPIEKWRNKHYLKNENFVDNAILYFGIGFEEMHRAKAIIDNWKPFEVRMPLIDHNISIDAVLKKYNIRQPILYDYGFAHNNCNGRCVKAGQGHFMNLHHKMPEVYQEVMQQEHYLKLYVSAYHYIKNIDEHGFSEETRNLWLQELDNAYRDYFYGRKSKPDVYIQPNLSIKLHSFMKKTKDKVTSPYPLTFLKRDIQNEGEQIDIFDIGGCGCFSDPMSVCVL